jgi:hypothetical protein
MVRVGAARDLPQDQRLHDACLEIAERAGALLRCRAGHGDLVRRQDDRAEANAFATAALAQSCGHLRAFDLDAIVATLGAILDDTADLCSSCAEDDRSARDRPVGG